MRITGAVFRLVVFGVLAAWVASGQGLPMEPVHDSGQSITGAYEGWFENPDGSFSLLVGYYNRSQKAAVELPVGAENRIEPGGPDRGQPTHFLPGRQWGVFTIRVPKDFGDAKLTWTITANGKTTQIPMSLNVLWQVEPFKDTNRNTPPYISFGEGGPFRNGPRVEPVAMATTVGAPLSLPIWAIDDEMRTPGTRRPQTPPVTLSWGKFRGPGTVTFSPERPAVEKMDIKAAPPDAVFTGMGTTAASFSESGEYLLRVVANDWTGDGGRGFQCCWTNGFVKVTVSGTR